MGIFFHRAQGWGNGYRAGEIALWLPDACQFMSLAPVSRLRRECVHTQEGSVKNDRVAVSDDNREESQVNVCPLSASDAIQTLSISVSDLWPSR